MTSNDQRVLLIDDDAISSEFIKGVLAASGWSCMTLQSPIGATRTILEHQIRYVLIDVSMPAMRGDALARLIRTNNRLQDRVILLVSSRPKVELDELVSQSMADGGISKDNVEAELVPTLNALAR